MAIMRSTGWKADGSEQACLAEGGKDKCPSWSPDGEKNVFQSTCGGHWGIYTMNSDGSEQPHFSQAECDSPLAKWSGYLTPK